MSDYDDETQIAKWNGAEILKALPIAEVFNLTGQLVDLAREAKITEREIERYRTVRDIAITEIIERYKFAHALLNKTFEDRRMIIEKHFEAIDKGLEENNFQLVEAGMQHVTAIVKDNPFKLFQETTLAERHRMLEEGDLPEL